MKKNTHKLFKDLEGNFTVKIDDTTAFGMSHHNHSKHRVYVNGLTYRQAKRIAYVMNWVVSGDYKGGYNEVCPECGSLNIEPDYGGGYYCHNCEKLVGQKDE